MKITVEKTQNWDEVLDCASATIWKQNSKIPSLGFMRRMATSEHSPLRELMFKIRIEGVRSWVAVHLVRHHIGVEKYVSTQRVDRVKSEVPRDEKPQGALVNVLLKQNAQSLINTSKLRLCHCASPETVHVWRGVIREVKKLDPVIGNSCVPSCVYRGFCPEGKEAEDRCKYTKEAIQSWRKRYLNERT